LPSTRGIDAGVLSRIVSKSERETAAVGRRIGRLLHPGDTVLIHGELGAGKTALVRGIARGLGVQAPVTSPTFTIANEYPYDGGRLVHIDQYRITPDGFWEEGLDEYWDGQNIVAVEWPRAHPPVPDALTVRIERTEDGREISIWGKTGRWEGLIR